MYGMFNSSALSSDNYNLILIGWASKNLRESVSLGAGSTKYCSGATARDILVILMVGIYQMVVMTPPVEQLLQMLISKMQLIPV